MLVAADIAHILFWTCCWPVVLNMLLTCVLLPCLQQWPQLVADLAVQPDSAEVWAYLARLYLDVLQVSDWNTVGSWTYSA